MDNLGDPITSNHLHHAVGVAWIRNEFLRVEISNSYFMILFQHLSCTLANDDTGRHGVAGCDAWHD